MWNQLKLIYIFVGLIILCICGNASATGYKTTELNRKLAEISNLQHGLSVKRTLATDKKKQLELRADTLKDEIRQEMDQLRIDSYQKATLTPRIDYNLKLIQLLLGYIARLDDKIVYLQNGQETLQYYFQQAQDDLLMIKILNDLEVDKLISQINSALDQYTPETTRPLFNADSVSLKDAEQIWKDIIGP